jgi:FkbM family methyltransferase
LENTILLVGVSWKLLGKAKIHIEELSTYLIILAHNKDLVFVFDEVLNNVAGSIVSRIANRRIPTLPLMAKTFALHHKKRMLAFYSRLIKKGDLCFDVGANVGKFTEVLLELGAKVVCVEPQETCLSQLRKLFCDNKNVIIVPKALGECEGEGELATFEENLGMSTLSAKYKNTCPPDQLSGLKWSKMKRVPITTLDNLILSYGLPKYCKIDVEGFEAQVLKGLSKPIRLVSFEFHRWCFEEAEKCVNRLVQIGNVEFNYMFADSMKFLLQKWVSPEELYKKIDVATYILDNRFYLGDIYARFV